MKNIEQKKADAKQAYKEAKKAYLENMSNETGKHSVIPKRLV